MRKIQRLVTILFLLLVASMGTVVLSRPLNQEGQLGLAILHLDICNAPCWIGITPGITSLDDALERLRDVYKEGGVLAERPKDGHAFAVAQSFSVELSYMSADPNPVIKGIHISFADFKPVMTVIDVLNRWGPPTYLCCAHSRVPAYDYMMAYLLDSHHEIDVWTSVHGRILGNMASGVWTPDAEAINPLDPVDRLLFRYQLDGQQANELKDVFHAWMNTWHGFVDFDTLLCKDYIATYDWISCPKPQGRTDNQHSVP